MKRLLSIAIALLMLCNIAALAEIEIDESQFAQPFDFALKDFRRALRYYGEVLQRESIVWEDGEEAEGGLRYKVCTTGDMLAFDAILDADDRIRAFTRLLSVTTDLSSSAPLSRAFPIAFSAMTDVILSACTAKYESQSSELPDRILEVSQELDDYSAALANWVDALSDSDYERFGKEGLSFSREVMGNSLTTVVRMDLSFSEKTRVTVETALIYTPEEYSYS